MLPSVVVIISKIFRVVSQSWSLLLPPSPLKCYTVRSTMVSVHPPSPLFPPPPTHPHTTHTCTPPIFQAAGQKPISNSTIFYVLRFLSLLLAMYKTQKVLILKLTTYRQKPLGFHARKTKQRTRWLFIQQKTEQPCTFLLKLVELHNKLGL